MIAFSVVCFMEGMTYNSDRYKDMGQFCAKNRPVFLHSPSAHSTICSDLVWGHFIWNYVYIQEDLLLHIILLVLQIWLD